MNYYDECYYIIKRDGRFDDLSVDPSKETAKRRFKFKELNYGDKSTLFHTDTNDLEFLDSENVIFFCSPNFIVSKKLRDKIDFGLFESKFFSAIIESKNGQRRDDFWVLNTFGKLDCWDREKSIIDDPDGFVYEEDGIEIFPSVVKFSLDSSVLDKIPEMDRLIFKMGKTDTQPIFVHQKIVDIFQKNNVKGVKFFRVSDYEFGDEF